MDLSKLLGDLYETNEADAPVDAPLADTPVGDASATAPAAAQPPGPDWADERLLDEAFASWTPGPPDDAPAAEREMANGFPGTSYPQLEGQFAHLGLEDPSERTEVPTDVDDDPVDAGPPRSWSRADDDVLPHRRSGRRGLRLSLRRR